jgi:hypothetical protein
MIIGVSKLDRHIMKAMSAPAVTDGKTSGRVTRKNLRKPVAPRFSAASSRERSTVVSAPEARRKT